MHRVSVKERLGRYENTIIPKKRQKTNEMKSDTPVFARRQK